MEKIDAPSISSTRPYLIRALYEWCTDNGLTPYLGVAVDDSVQVPREFVKEGEIVLNISFDATTALKLGNEFIEFKARFGGVARQIIVPIEQVSGIYARENGQGMAFPIGGPKATKQVPLPGAKKAGTAPASLSPPVDAKPTLLVTVESTKRSDSTGDGDEPPRSPPSGPRPALKRVK